MRKKVLFGILVAVLGVGTPLIAAWCEGSGPGWFVSCTDSICTITTDQGGGVWRAENVPRAKGEALCDHVIEEPEVP